MKNSELGSWIDGIGATEDLDSSGERISIKGIDISSLTTDGLINTEHKSDTASQVIGKVVEAKKISKEEECENDRHKHFWKLARKRPFLYVAAVLFDKVGHVAAADAVAMFKFDKLINTDKTKGTGWFSIEGGRMGKEGSNITKCVARKIAFTNLPCNKACVAELLEDPDKYCKSITKEKVQASMKKAEADYQTLIKAEPKKYFKELGMPKTPKGLNYSKITPATGEHRPANPAEPKRTFTSQNAPDKMKVGDRITHNKPKAKAGASFYRDLYKDNSNPIRKQVWDSAKQNKEENMKPSKKEIMKHLGDEAWENFKGKDILIDIIQKKDPELTKAEVLGIAKTMAYMDMKKKESELEDMFEKDEDKSVGVHTPSKTKGVSLAGDAYRQSKKHTGNTKKYLEGESKEIHAQKLQELKRQPKPNLPKSEKPFVKDEAGEKEVRMIRRLNQKAKKFGSRPDHRKKDVRDIKRMVSSAKKDEKKD